MKRLPVALCMALCLLMLPAAAHAFDTERGAARIGLLRGFDDTQQYVIDQLRHELRTRGFDAFDAELDYDDVTAEDHSHLADYFVEVVGGQPDVTEHGGVGIDTRHGGVSLGVLVSRVAAEVRVYDARTLELVGSHEMRKKNTAIVPTSVGVGGGAIFAWVALPFIERAQYRSAARAAAKDAAMHVTAAIRADEAPTRE
jgi:hypothetical protein